MSNPSHPFAAWNPERAEEIARSLAHEAGPCLPVLHALQAEFGYIDTAAVAIVADVLNLSRAEVVGVVGFYHDFRDAPPSGATIQVCRAEACQSMGGEALYSELTGSGQVDADVDAVYCLGNCALSPAAMVNGRLVGRASAARVAALLTEAKP